MDTRDIARIAELCTDLAANHTAVGRSETIYLRAMREIEFLQGVIQAMATKLHQRRCWDCGHVGWYAEAYTPYCLCDECRSQDTRRIKTNKPTDASEKHAESATQQVAAKRSVLA